MTGQRRGHQRERDVRRILDAEGWWTCRATGSFGDADIIALRYAPYEMVFDGSVEDCGRIEAMFVEVKSTAAGPFHSFGPRDRAELIAAGVKSGARPMLAWWPPHGKLTWLSVHEWPAVRVESLDGSKGTTS